MSEYAGYSVKKEKIIDLTPDLEAGTLFTVEDAPAKEQAESLPPPSDDPVEQLARERTAYEQTLRDQGRTEERIHYLVGRQFGPRIARLALQHDVGRLLQSEPRHEEKPDIYRDVRSAAANDRLDD